MRSPVASVASEVSQVLSPRPHLPAHRGPAEADRSEASPFEMLLDSANGANEPAAASRNERPDRPERRDDAPQADRRADASSQANDRADAKDSNAAADRKDAAEGKDAAGDATDAKDTKDTGDSKQSADASNTDTTEQKPADADAMFDGAAPTQAQAPAVTPVEQPVIAVEIAAAAAEAAPETIAPVALPIGGKTAGAEIAGQPEQDGTQAEGQAKSAKAEAPAPAMPANAAGRDGEEQNADKRAANLAKAAENARSAADADAKSQKSDAPKLPQLGTDAAIKGAAEAVQNLGLTAPASQAGATANAAQVNAAAAASAQAPTAPVPLPELAVHIASQALGGKQRFEIRLDPPELGRIDVRLDVDRDGHVTSRLTVDRADTLDLLRRDAAQLERALQQAGLKTSDGALEFSLRQHAPGRDDAPAQNGGPLVAAEDDPAPLETARQHYGRLLGLGAGLDIRV